MLYNHGSHIVSQILHMFVYDRSLSIELSWARRLSIPWGYISTSCRFHNDRLYMSVVLYCGDIDTVMIYCKQRPTSGYRVTRWISLSLLMHMFIPHFYKHRALGRINFDNCFYHIEVCSKMFSWQVNFCSDNGMVPSQGELIWTVLDNGISYISEIPKI